MDDATRLPGGPEVGLGALDAAIDRAYAGKSGPLYGESATSAAVTEALFWIAALDDHFQRETPDYFQRRASDERGRTVAGLIYARNLAGHGLHAASAVRYELGSFRAVKSPPGEPPAAAGRGTLFSAQFEWARLAELPTPRREERNKRDQMYEQHVEGQPLTEPLQVARDWFASL